MISIPEKPGQKSIELNDWKFTTIKQPIFNSQEMAEHSERIKIPFPEMYYGHNLLEIQTPKASTIRFNALEALECVKANENESIKVAMAQAWTSSSLAKHSHIQKVVKPYDWTYTTEYKGSLENGDFYQSSLKIDTAKLALPDPILFYDEVSLYEDELGDNGSAFYSVKIRVMPTTFLVLGRFFLRVDGVLVKILDTRLYHQFGTSILIREFKERSIPSTDIIKKLSLTQDGRPDTSLLTDMEFVSRLLDESTVVRTVTDHLLV